MVTGLSQKQIEDIVYRVLTKFYQNVLLVRMPVKEDLDRFATKEDLEQFASKEDFERLENKVDLVAGKVTILESNHERRIRRVETKLKLPPLAMD